MLERALSNAMKKSGIKGAKLRRDIFVGTKFSLLDNAVGESSAVANSCSNRITFPAAIGHPDSFTAVDGGQIAQDGRIPEGVVAIDSSHNPMWFCFFYAVVDIGKHALPPQIVNYFELVMQMMLVDVFLDKRSCFVTRGVVDIDGLPVRVVLRCDRLDIFDAPLFVVVGGNHHIKKRGVIFRKKRVLEKGKKEVNEYSV